MKPPFSVRCPTGQFRRGPVFPRGSIPSDRESDRAWRRENPLGYPRGSPNLESPNPAGVIRSGEDRWEGPSRLRQEAIYGRGQKYSGLLKGVLWYSEVDIKILNKQNENVMVVKVIY